MFSSWSSLFKRSAAWGGCLRRFRGFMLTASLSLSTCAGVVRRVCGAEPTDRCPAQRRGRRGSGGAEGAAAAAERRLLQPGVPAGDASECPAGGARLPRHHAGGNAAPRAFQLSEADAPDRSALCVRSCPSSWTAFWACSVPTCPLPTGRPFSKTSNCWRRNCRLLVCSPSERIFPSLSSVTPTPFACSRPTQKQACPRSVRRGRWCWSRCAARRRGLWRRRRARLESSRTTFSTFRLWWRRWSCASRGSSTPLLFMEECWKSWKMLEFQYLESPWKCLIY